MPISRYHHFTRKQLREIYSLKSELTQSLGSLALPWTLQDVGHTCAKATEERGTVSDEPCLATLTLPSLCIALACPWQTALESVFQQSMGH